MQVFRNKNFIKRNFECQNVVACVAEKMPATADNRWVTSTEESLSGLSPLYTQAGVQYYGFG